MTNTKEITDIDILWNNEYYFSCKFSIEDAYIFSDRQISNYIDMVNTYVSHMGYNFNAYALYDKYQTHFTVNDTQARFIFNFTNLICELPKNTNLKYVLNPDMLNTYFLLYDVQDFCLPQTNRPIVNEIYRKTKTDISTSYISIKSDENTDTVKTVISPIFALHRTKEEIIYTSVSYKEKEY